MSNWVYSTDHGRFLLPSEKVPHALEALKECIAKVLEGSPTPFVPASFEEALSFFDLTALVNQETGDVVNIHPEETHLSELSLKVLRETIAPFVDDGSFLVFAFGASDGCWAIAFHHDPEHNDVVRGYETDVAVVLEDDLTQILDRLTKHDPVFGEAMVKKYLFPSPKEPIDG